LDRIAQEGIGFRAVLLIRFRRPLSQGKGYVLILEGVKMVKNRVCLYCNVKVKNYARHIAEEHRTEFMLAWQSGDGVGGT